MTQNSLTRCLIVLAGGQSRRMGQQKATLQLGDERLVDRVIRQHGKNVDLLLLSAPGGLDTGLDFVPDDPRAPDGPAGAIFTLADKLANSNPGLAGFVTIPVDAPFVPDKLVADLLGSSECAIARSPERVHPTVGYWRCEMVNALRATLEAKSTPPSLQWIAEQCGAKMVEWPDEQAFMNINTPVDLRMAEALALQ